MDGCQNYGTFLGPYCNTAPLISGTPKRYPNFDNHPYVFALMFGLVCYAKDGFCLKGVSAPLGISSSMEDQGTS